MWILGLILFHLVFWRRFYQNPFTHFTGESAAHEFPSARFLGESIRKGVYPPKDIYYWGDYSANPINTTFYPPHVLTAWIGSYLSLDRHFILHTGCILAHYLFASVVGYYLFGEGLVGFFGAVTLAYMGYNIKGNASIVYTVSWMPVCLLGAKMGSCYLLALGWGMALLGGYWPLAVYFGPFAWLVSLFLR